MSNQNFTDVFCREVYGLCYGYRSGLSVYEERFVNNALVAAGWNGAGYPLNVLTNCPNFINYTDFNDPSTFHIELDGQSVDYLLDLVGFETIDLENGSKEAILTLKSKIKPVEIKVHTLLDGTPVFTRWLEVTNLSDKEMALSKLSVFSGALEQTLQVNHLTHKHTAEDMYQISYFESDQWAHEGKLVTKTLNPDKTTIGGRFTRGRYRYPAIYIQNKMNGGIFFAQLGWTGGYEFSLENMFTENSWRDVTLGFDIAVTGFKPLRMIEAGETFVSPEVHIGYLIGTMDDVTNATYDHIRKSVLNKPGTESACMVGAGMGAEHDMSVETTKRYADQMAECGAEVFIVDAGWNCPPGKEMTEWRTRVGDYYPNPDRYPNGFMEIVDYIHSKGMKFGLWMEPDRIGTQAPIYKEHPDWFVKPAYTQTEEGFLDFTNPEAAAWVESEITRAITDYKLDLFRIDCNVGSDHYFTFHEGNHTNGGAVKHFEAFYAMFDRLKKRFPDVIFENCAGGGGRTDLGMLKNFNHSWVTDWQRAPRSLYITQGMTHVLPPEKVDRLVAGMGCHEIASLSFHMRNAMLSHMTLNVFSCMAATWNPRQIEFVKHSVQLYKDFIRPMLPTSRMYHHTMNMTSATEQNHLVMELASAERNKAAITVFTLPGWEHGTVTVYPKGLDVTKTYQVTLDNSGDTYTVSGRELCQKGVTTFPLGTMDSELILIEEK